jgi:hypothetical protein
MAKAVLPVMPPAMRERSPMSHLQIWRVARGLTMLTLACLILIAAILHWQKSENHIRNSDNQQKGQSNDPK